MDPYKAPAPGPNQYDFILNDKKAPKKPLLGGSGFRKRLIVIVGGAMLIMLILTVITLLLSSGSGNTNQRLQRLAVEQEEIIRVAEIGSDEASSLKTRSFAYTTKLSVTSQQAKLLAYLESEDVKLKTAQLTTGVDPETDEALELAKDRNQFDETMDEILNSLIATYANNLETALRDTKNKTVKEFLGVSYTSASLLINPEFAAE